MALQSTNYACFMFDTAIDSELDDAAGMTGDRWRDNVVPRSLPGRHRPFRVLLHEPCIGHHICGEHGGKTLLDGLIPHAPPKSEIVEAILYEVGWLAIGHAGNREGPLRVIGEPSANVRLPPDSGPKDSGLGPRRESGPRKVRCTSDCGRSQQFLKVSPLNR